MMEFTFQELVKLKVKNRWRLCLQYSCVDKHGELHEGGLISLDKMWMKPCATDGLVSRWYKIKFNPETSGYSFPDPDCINEDDYVVYQQLIDAVDSILIEQGILGLNHTAD